MHASSPEIVGRGAVSPPRSSGKRLRQAFVDPTCQSELALPRLDPEQVTRSGSKICMTWYASSET